MKKIKAKIAFLGDHAVGKTTLIQMYLSNSQNYAKDYVMTQGAELSSKIVPFENRNKDVEMFFFDISGQDLYKSFVPELLKDTNFIVLVFDCTNADSFQNLGDWYNQAKKANNSKPVPGILVATKCDSKTSRQVEMMEAVEAAKKLGMDYFETAAARNMDIEPPFLALAEKILNSSK